MQSLKIIVYSAMIKRYYNNMYAFKLFVDFLTYLMIIFNYIRKFITYRINYELQKSCPNY